MREVRAFAPGRVNLIGEHTDYNDGLALALTIEQGVTVRAREIGEPVIRAHALNLDRHEQFSLGDHGPASGWLAFVKGSVAELQAAKHDVPGTELWIEGDLPLGGGLSSSAALSVALCVALLGLTSSWPIDRRTLARICSRVENVWVGAHTGLLDQLTCLFGELDAALLIDFRNLEIESIPLNLQRGWQLVTVDSGERHSLANSAYNERRRECTQACELLGVDSLRDLRTEDLSALPALLGRRVRHVLDENERVLDTVRALLDGDLERVGQLLDAAHASLRDLYECSTAAIERARATLKRQGATGARMIGGGFGGQVLGLLGPGSSIPAGAHLLSSGAGARLFDSGDAQG